MIVQGQADAHVMQRGAGMDGAAVEIGKVVGLAIDHAAFDVPEPVPAMEALEFITAVVQMLALDGGGQRHGISFYCRLGGAGSAQAALAAGGEGSGVIFSRRI